MNEKDGRTRILEAAAQVFATSGYHHASISQVAELAGVTNPAIYYHFNSKEGLYEAVLDRAYSHFKHHIERVLSAAEGLRDKLIAFTDLCIFIFLSSLQSPRAGCAERWLDTFATETKSLLTNMFRNGLEERCQESKLEFAVMASLSLLVGVVQHILLGETKVEFTPNTVEQLVDLLLRGLRLQ